MQGPCIQFGAYWARPREPESFRRLLRWLLARNYNVKPKILAVKAIDDELPRFVELAAGRDEIEISGWTSDRILSSRELLPTKVNLTSENKSNVDVLLGYGLMDSESFQGGDKHVVELMTSGADLNLVDNVGTSETDLTTVRSAWVTRQWCLHTFRDLCDELEPDYAGKRWEKALQPPKSFLASTDSMDYFDLYLSNCLVDGVEIREKLRHLSDFVLEEFKSGVFIMLRPGIDHNRLEVDFAMACVRAAVRLSQELGAV